MSIVSLCYLGVFTLIMQVSTSVIAEFKSKPIITPESLMVTRPYMGKGCSCMPISQVLESVAYMNSEKFVFLYLISLNVCYYNILYFLVFVFQVDFSTVDAVKMGFRNILDLDIR